MFRRLHDLDRPQVLFAFEGRQIVGRTGDTVAAALLEAGQPVSRATAKDGAPRGPFCMMGCVSECLMVIDGQANRQACRRSFATA